MKLKVGQKVWFDCWEWEGDSHHVILTKVGTKWAHCKELRGKIDLSTGQVHDHYLGVVGRIHLSKEAYDHYLELYAEMDRLSCDANKGPVDGVTLEDIAAARQLLRLPV